MMFLAQFGVMALSAMMAFGSPQPEAEPYAEEPHPAIVTEAYEYPVTPNDPEWAELGSTQARIKACRIPQEVLERMTEEQLVQAVLDFPFRVELFVYSYIETGIESMEKNCDAYAELLRRGTAKEALMGRIACQPARSTATMEERQDNDVLATLILYQKQIEESLSDEEIDYVKPFLGMFDMFSYEAYKARNAAASEPKTPDGTTVDYATPSCEWTHSESDHTQWDKDMEETYHVMLVSSGTCRYNCHSYAWHDQSPSNISGSIIRGLIYRMAAIPKYSVA